MQWNQRLRLGLALLASGAAFGLAGSAYAQPAFSAPYREDPGNALSRHLKTLAESPRNLSALTGAAKAALALGDAQAAVTFYARAEEISPRDGRIKAGIGSAFVAMEQPQAAMRFFDEARGLGAPEGEYAADRGLAHDLLGDPVQAQRDYQIAMRTHDGEEVRRRLALSRAISGDRAGALAAIDDQLRRQDRAAWRVRAFVLALTGDPGGATDAARSVMPQQAAAMQPFFARLPSLRPAERAMAVHFGHFPGDRPSTSTFSEPTYAGLGSRLPSVVTDAGRPSTSQPGFRSITPPTVQSNVGAGPRRGVSGPPQLRPVQTAPATQIARSGATAPAAANRSEPNALQQRWNDARGISSPTRIARNDARAPVAPAQRAPQSRNPSAVRGTGSSAQDRVSGIYSRSPSSSQAPARSAPSSQAGSGQQFAAVNARPPAATGSTPVQPSARPAPVASGPVQGPPVPADLGVRNPAPNIQPGAAAPTVAPTPNVPTSSPASMAPAQSLQPVISTPPAATALSSTGIAANAPVAQPVIPPLSSAPATTAPAQTAPGIQSITPPPSAPAESAAAPPASTSAPAPQTPALTGTSLTGALADIAATVRALPTVEPEPAKPSAPAKKVAEKAPAPAKAKAEPAPAKAPSRHWVQIAGAADKSSLRGEFSRLKAKAPKLFADKTAWTTPLRYTNRLLVGPFETEGKAQGFVNELAKAELTAFSWTSPAGQEIEKLAGK